MPYTLEIIQPDGKVRALEATEEQVAIIEQALSHPEECIQIIAFAGTAKTTTLRFLAKYMPIVPTLSVAFNKRIAEEMQRVLPSHFKSSTVNSVGHRVWAAATGKRLTLDTKKNYNLIKAEIDGLPRRDKEMAYDAFGDMTKALSAAKLNGYVPPGIACMRRLLDQEAFYAGLDDEPEGWFIEIVDRALLAGIKQAYAGLIDFDDQIYMPTLFGGSFPQFPRVMVDEAQDLSALNHAMLEKLVGPKTQLIAVGDPFQSIYAFRGAVTNSMSRLRDRFSMKVMTLSVSFRCPIKVIEKARSRVPEMKWPSWAAEGRVETLNEWNAKDIPDRSAIVCRNNAPLLSCALSLLRSGRGVHLVGTDLGPQLVRALKKFGDPQMTQEKVHDAINAWEQEKLRKSRNAGSVSDRAECLRVFADFGPTLGAAIAYAEHLFAANGPIQLLSGHKAKGLEWDTVYHLDPHRIPSPFALEGEAREQELNVRYVIETRPKKELFLVRLEDLINGETAVD